MGEDVSREEGTWISELFWKKAGMKRLISVAEDIQGYAAGCCSSFLPSH